MKTIKHNFIVIDVETSSTEPEKGSIIQLGAVKIFKGKLESNYIQQKREHFCYFVKPYIYDSNGIAWSDECQKIHNISKETLSKSGIEATDVCKNFKRWIGKEDYILCTWGNCFDIHFLKSMFSVAGVPYSFGRNYIDIKSCYLIKRNPIGKDRNVNYIKEACEKYNIVYSLEKHHNALNDAEYASEILWNLLVH